MKPGSASPGGPTNRDLYYLVKEMMRFLLGTSDTHRRMCDLLSRFDSLRLSGHEFTCLKFLAIFNPHKHG